MPIRFAINGLGRVGRALTRITEADPRLELAAINDSATPAILARLLAHDTLHGPFPGQVAAAENALIVNGRRVPVYGANRPQDIPWAEAEPLVVVEATGQFRTRVLAQEHLGGSVRRVVVSATADNVDATFCFGINHGDFDPDRHQVVSNASCTTNCLAPVAKVLDESFGIEQAQMSTVHCYTNSQRLVDMAHPDPRRARAAAMNIIPTTSDAVDAVGKILPRLDGKIRGGAYRVPVPDGSLVDLVATLSVDAKVGELRDAFVAAANGPLAGILAVTDEELVSTDYIGNPHSATVDLPLLSMAGSRLARVVAWYDNEWGYANRLASLMAWMESREE